MAPVQKGFGKIGLEADGLIEIQQRAFQVAFGFARNAPVIEGFGKVGA